MKKALLVAAALAVGSSVLAQDHPNFQRGLGSPASYASGQLDAINVFNGNLTLQIPIGITYPVNGNLSYGLTLRYNSQVWNFQTGGSGTTEPDPNSGAGLGWSLSLGRLYKPFTPPHNNTANFVLIEGDGAKRTFRSTLHPGEGIQTGVFYTHDGSYQRLTCLNGTSVTSPGSVVACSGAYTQVRVESPGGTRRIFKGPGLLTPQVPGSVPTEGQLVAIQDPFANRVDIFYSVAPAPGSPDLGFWRIHDPHGRVHTISYYNCHPLGQTCISDVQLQMVDGVVALYDFEYTEDVFLFEEAGGNSYDLLDSVTGPHGETYTMEYWPATKGLFEGEGALRTITLPTLGIYEYLYSVYAFQTSQLPLNIGCGVVEKRSFKRSGEEGVWQYRPNEPSGIANTAKRVLKDPMGNETVSYFGNYAGADPRHGLPVSTTLSDARALSQLFYEGTEAANVLRRSVYTRYVVDAPDNAPFALSQKWGNARVESTRTIYHDDSLLAVDLFLSDFDGLGHYRSVQTPGFPGESARLDEMVVNSSNNYDCPHLAVSNPNPEQTCSSTGTPPSSWLLNNVFETRQQQGVAATQVQQYCVDTSTGFVQRHRVLVGATPASTDLLRIYSQTNGNVFREEFYGGDVTPAAVIGCGTDPIQPPKYDLRHTYSAGVLASSRYESGLLNPEYQRDRPG